LQESQLRVLSQSAQQRATAVASFFGERRDDLENLSLAREIPIYFENESLGMSMEYGLRASLFSIEGVFDRLREGKKLRGAALYSRIVLLDAKGALLVARGAGPYQEPSGDPGGLPWRKDGDSLHAQTEAGQTLLVLATPFLFKGHYAGHLLAWIPLSVVYAHFVEDSAGTSPTAVALGSAYLHPPGASALPAALRSRPPDVPPRVPTPIEDPEGRGSPGFVISVPVDGTPISLVTFLPVPRGYDLGSPLALLLATGGMAIVLLAGIVVVINQNTRNTTLKVRLEEASLQQRALDDKNRELETEVADRKRAEEALRASESRHSALLSAIPDMMFLQSADGVYLDYHTSEGDTLLAPPELFLGRNMREVLPPDIVERFLPVFGGALRDGGPEVLEYSVGEGGAVRHFEARVVRCAVDKVLSIVRDVTEAKNAAIELVEKQRRLDHLAHHDPLTGLPNRLLFHDRFQQAISRAKRQRTAVTLLFLDLDRFKNVNDTLGHDVGDRLLTAAAERLRRCVREVDTVARIGGDEFTIVLEGDVGAQDATAVASKVIKSLATPFEIGTQELFVGTSVGITAYPRDGMDSETLMRNADAALYHAKEAGRGTFRFFTEELNQRAMRDLHREISLRHALARGELTLHYQPQVDARTGRILATEALLRWFSPEFGPVPPAELVSLAEDTGLIVPIGDWVLRKACEQTSSWQREGHAGLRVAVNLSARQFRQGDLVGSVLATLHDTGLPPSCLELELTESVLLRDVPAAAAILAELRKAGIRISIDDFGVGFSSLRYLKLLPLDTLKVAQEFVRDILTEPHDAAIATAIVSLANALGIATIAEGVETREHLDFFLSQGCFVIQGFFFSRPIPPGDLGRLLAGGGFVSPG
jgi:diguanylate cyclase (GGDEF)-like protein